MDAFELQTWQTKKKAKKVALSYSICVSRFLFSFFWLFDLEYSEIYFYVVNMDINWGQKWKKTKKQSIIKAS